MPTLTEIAQTILESARTLDEYTESQGLDPTSFSQNTVLEAARKKLVDSTTELKSLVQGPIGQLYDVLFAVCVNILFERETVTRLTFSVHGSYEHSFHLPA
jgi:hypothetical protein